MCLAVPLKLINIEGNEAVAERDGIERKIRVDFINEPKVGDNVIVHAGFAIERVSAEQAEETQSAYEELNAALREIAEEDRQRRSRKEPPNG